TRAFSHLRVRLGAELVEEVPYSELDSIYAATLTNQEVDFVRQTQKLGITNVFATQSTVEFAFPIISSLLVSMTNVPLALAKMGLTLEFVVANTNEVFTSSNVNHFTIDEPYILSKFIEPPLDFTMGLVSKVSNMSAAAKIPYEIVKNTFSYGNNANKNQ